jgi:hypothetical protein
MKVNSERLHNIERAIRLALKGDPLGFAFINMYCYYGNDVAKQVVCLPVLFRPDMAPFAPCCLRHLDLVIAKARSVGIPEPVIHHAVAVITGAGSRKTRSSKRKTVGSRKRGSA